MLWPGGGLPLFLEREQPSFRSVRRVGVRLSFPCRKTRAPRAFPARLLFPRARTNANNIYTDRSRSDRLLHRKADEKKAARSMGHVRAILASMIHILIKDPR